MPNEYDFRYDSRQYEGIPCQAACPVHTDVQGYIKLIADGDFEGAHRLIRETNPFPAICGRVCQHYCERACNRGMMDSPVAIMQLKRAATDYSKREFKLPDHTYNTLEKVAVIGAGPCGLTAAHDLARMGYRVTVFESFPHPGGMMRYGIPAYRLPREVIDYEVDYIKRLGVDIRYNVTVGKDIQLEELQDEFDSVLITAGAHKAVTMGVPGEDLQGVYHGCTFMRLVNEGKSVPPMEGKVVAVVGGGFTAMDVSRSAVRLGAKKVYIVYRRTRDEIPVNEKEICEAEDENIEFLYLIAPTEVVSEDGKNVSGMKCIKNQMGEPGEDGRRRPEPIPDSEFVLECDYVMPAVSQAPDSSFIDEETSGLKLNRWGTLDIDEKTFATDVPGLYAAGDFITGTRDIILVVADGHTAAISIDSYLKDKRAVYERTEDLKVAENLKMEKRPRYDSIKRSYPEVIPMEHRCSTFEEVERTFSIPEAMDEASRCFNCNHQWKYNSDSCILCMNCVDVCPQKCLNMDQLSELEWNRLLNENISLKEQGINGIGIDRDLCIRCTFCEQVCPTDSISFNCFSRDKAKVK